MQQTIEEVRVLVKVGKIFDNETQGSPEKQDHYEIYIYTKIIHNTDI